jgi:hypothetical protein
VGNKVDFRTFAVMVQSANKILRINFYSPNITESIVHHESFVIHCNDQTCAFSVSNAPIISSLFQETAVPNHDDDKVCELHCAKCQTLSLSA